MGYRLKPEAAAWEPLPGVPWRDMSDVEYAEVAATYDAQFSPEQRGSLARFFEHVKEKDATGAKAGAGGSTR